MASRRLLIVNPNTDERVTGWLAAEAQRAAGSQWELEAVNAASGLVALETPQHVAHAAEAVIDIVQARRAIDGVLIGAFGDPGLAALRQREPCRRVVGLGEAGLQAAAAGGRRFAIVTLGATMDEPLRRRVAELGYGDLLAGLSVLPVPISRFVASRNAHMETLAAAVKYSFEQDGAQAVLLGGAPFAGIAATLRTRFDTPVLDGVAESIAALEQQTNICNR